MKSIFITLIASIAGKMKKILFLFFATFLCVAGCNNCNNPVTEPGHGTNDPPPNPPPATDSEILLKRKLANPGWNTCYMNSFLQTIKSIPIYEKLFDYAEDDADKKELAEKGKAIMKFLEKGEEVTKDMLENFYASLEKNGWDENKKGTQQDVHELITTLMDILNFKTVKVNTIKLINTNNDWGSMGYGNEPFLQTLIKKDSSMQDNIDSHFDIEILEDYSYNGAKKQNYNSKDLILDAPSFLPIHLKRFNNNREKVTDRVNNPMRIKLK